MGGASHVRASAHIITFVENGDRIIDTGKYRIEDFEKNVDIKQIFKKHIFSMFEYFKKWHIDFKDIKHLYLFKK